MFHTFLDIDVSQDHIYYKFLLKLSVIHNQNREKNWFKSLKILSEIQEFENDVKDYNEKRLLNKSFRTLIKNCCHGNFKIKEREMINKQIMTRKKYNFFLFLTTNFKKESKRIFLLSTITVPTE